MFEKDMSKLMPALTAGSTEDELVDEEHEVDQLMDDDSLLYNLGWTVLPVQSGDDTSAGKSLPVSVNDIHSWTNLQKKNRLTILAGT